MILSSSFDNCSVFIATATTLFHQLSAVESHTELRSAISTGTLLGAIHPPLIRVLVGHGLSPFTAVSNIVMVCY